MIIHNPTEQYNCKQVRRVTSCMQICVYSSPRHTLGQSETFRSMPNLALSTWNKRLHCVCIPFPRRNLVCVIKSILLCVVITARKGWTKHINRSKDICRSRYNHIIINHINDACSYMTYVAAGNNTLYELATGNIGVGSPCVYSKE